MWPAQFSLKNIFADLSYSDFAKQRQLNVSIKSVQEIQAKNVWATKFFTMYA